MCPFRFGKPLHISNIELCTIFNWICANAKCEIFQRCVEQFANKMYVIHVQCNVRSRNVNFKNLAPKKESNWLLPQIHVCEFSIISAISRVIYSRQFHNKQLSRATYTCNYTWHACISSSSRSHNDGGGGRFETKSASNSRDILISRTHILSVYTMVYSVHNFRLQFTWLLDNFWRLYACKSNAK